MITGSTIGRVNDTDSLVVFGGIPSNGGGWVELYGKDHAVYPSCVSLKSQNSNRYSQLVMHANGEFFFDSNGTRKTIAMQEDVVPRSGGAVMTGNTLYKSNADGVIFIGGGNERDHGGNIFLAGSTYNLIPDRGVVFLLPNLNGQEKQMRLYPNGTWIWDGTACQITSDQRFKQQIAEIDDKLLDAWEDVELVQFKYNDAVDQKGDTARLHTGYVVQQIDEACKSHNLDISAYGLYCHEEYPERTEEVTTENEDGTTSKETKVIEPAREHYSLRYTETLVVECAYLRREVSRLKQQNEDLEQRLKMLENK